MIKEIRYSMILDYLKSKEIESVENISKDLSIPLTTLRRDLNELEVENKIIKLHGGAKLVPSNFINEDYLENKIKLNVDDKKKIALRALNKIKQNSTIFLDAGSNSFYLAQIIKPSLDVTIVTNSILNVQTLAQNGVRDIYILGGKFTDITGAILGYEAIEALKNYSFDICFLGINAVDENGDIYTTSSEHAQIKLEVIKHCTKVFGLVDKSKMNSKSFYKFATTKEIELIS